MSSEHAGGVERVMLDYPDAAAIEAGQTVGTTVTNSQGQPSLYTWEQPVGGSPRLLAATGPGCASCPPTGMRWDYDVAGRLSGATVTGGGTATGAGTLQYAHDEADRLVETRRTLTDGTSMLMERREYATLTDPQPVRITRPSVNTDGERVTLYERDERGRITAFTERGWSPILALPSETGQRLPAFVPIERRTRTRYAAGRVVAIDGPRDDVDDVTHFRWDDASRPVEVRLPAGPVLRFGALDALGRTTEIRIARGHPYRIDYGATGEVSAIEHRGTVTRFERDAEGRLTGLVDPEGRTMRIDRDAAGRPRSMTDAFGRTVRIGLDSESRESGRSWLGADGDLIRTLSIVRDANGRPLQQKAERTDDLDGSTRTSGATFEHDEQGHLRAVVGRDTGARVEIETDDIGRTVAFTQPGGASTRTLLDARGQPAGFVDARGNTTHELRDDFGQVVGIDSPDTGVERRMRNAAGQVIELVREDSGRTTYRRDAAGRRIERLTANGERTSWTYDETLGQLESVTNTAGTDRFEFDDDGLLTRHARTIDALQVETRYAYDERGRLIMKTLPDGSRLRHHYHEGGPNGGTLRAITREHWSGLGGGETIAAQIDLEARDGATGHVAGNGLRTERTFAPDGTLRTLALGGELALGYAFDDTGRIVRIEENGKRQDYGYAGVRLISAITEDTTWRYAYDAGGNRTARSVSRANGVSTSERSVHAEPGEGNRLLGIVDATTGATRDYEYDVAGSPTRIGALSYEYDEHRRPVAIRRDGALVARYAYNGFGERVKKVVYDDAGSAPVTTYFLYDGRALVAEIDGRANVTAQYVYLPGQLPVARLAGDQIHAIHADHRGAPRWVSDAAGQIEWRAEYDPFGQAQVDVARMDMPLRLPGQYHDAETGLHYNYYRDYDASTGRYLSADPIGLRGGPNLYGYVGSDPLSATDPLGLAVNPAQGLTIAVQVASLGSAFYAFLVTAAEVGVASVTVGSAAPVVAVVGVAALAVYFHRRFGGGNAGEAEFTSEAGGDKPSASDYAALQSELTSYASWMSDSPAVWDGSWSSYFEMAIQLEDAQRTFIADYEAVYGVGGVCSDAAVQAQYDNAVANVNAADAGAGVAASAGEGEAVDTANPSEPPPECGEKAQQIKKEMWVNRNANGGGRSGKNGYLRRLLEQICGESVPGSTGWNSHENELRGGRRRIQRSLNRMKYLGCPTEEELGAEDNKLAEEIVRQDSPWREDTQHYLGREDPRCEGWDTFSKGDDLEGLLEKLGVVTGRPM